MININLQADDIKVLLNAHLMVWGFPFHVAKKPGFDPTQRVIFDSLHENLHSIKDKFIAERELAHRDAKPEGFSMKATITADEHKILLAMFRSLAEEFPLGSDMDLRMHVPSREAFDSLHGRLKQLS